MRWCHSCIPECQATPNSFGSRQDSIAENQQVPGRGDFGRINSRICTALNNYKRIVIPGVLQWIHDMTASEPASGDSPKAHYGSKWNRGFYSVWKEARHFVSDRQTAAISVYCHCHPLALALAVTASSAYSPFTWREWRHLWMTLTKFTPWNRVAGTIGVTQTTYVWTWDILTTGACVLMLWLSVGLTLWMCHTHSVRKYKSTLHSWTRVVWGLWLYLNIVQAESVGKGRMPTHMLW